jgi:methionyl-tRNA synthetase
VGGKKSSTKNHETLARFYDASMGARADFRFHDALGALWSVMTLLNQRIDRTKPWEMENQGKKQQLHEFLDEMVTGLRTIAYWLEPFMPGTAARLQKSMFGEKPLKRGAPLFPRLKK